MNVGILRSNCPPPWQINGVVRRVFGHCVEVPTDLCAPKVDSLQPPSSPNANLVGGRGRSSYLEIMKSLS
jgi:hypothetical protein